MSFIDFILPRSRKKRQARIATEPRIYARDEHTVSRKDISESALKVLYRLNKAGYKAFLVGGGVRDALLGLKPKDFDIATDAHPEEIRDLFRNSRLIGRRFRLAHVRFGREVIEVATFRAAHDGDTDGAAIGDSGRILRDNVYGDIDDDVWRRDFTINALYYNIDDFSIVDYVGGFQDILDRRLRLIGDPAKRYPEDPVRMLRAVRFAAKLGLEIDAATLKSFQAYRQLLTEIAPARLFDESLKMLHSGFGLETFKTMRSVGLFECLFPQTEHVLGKDLSAENLIVEALRNTDDRVAAEKSVTPAFIFAALLWGPLQVRQRHFQEKGLNSVDAFNEAADEVISKQVRRVAIPRRFTTVTREIWALQPRLENRTAKRALRLIEHPRFRAAYDFLLVRSQAGEPLTEAAEWWTTMQETDAGGRNEMLEKLPKPKRGPRRRKRRASTQT